MIAEIHTSDLVAGCLRRVQLRHEGKVVGQCPSALYRGLLWHEMAGMLHRAPVARWSPELAAMIADEAHVAVLESLRAESRPLTPAAANAAPDVRADLTTLLGHYIDRFADWFLKSKTIAVEAPIRLLTTVDGKPQRFASHLDLLFRDPHGNLCVWDWKTGDDDWGGEHVARSMQVGMYYLATLLGKVCVDGEWIAFGESPHVAVVEVENLKPYTRRTTAKDDNGQDREFVKGDARPLTSVVREVLINNEDGVWAEWNTRVRLIRAGLYPTNPTADACRFCDSAKFCPSWTREADQ